MTIASSWEKWQPIENPPGTFGPPPPPLGLMYCQQMQSFISFWDVIIVFVELRFFWFIICLYTWIISYLLLITNIYLVAVHNRCDDWFFTSIILSCYPFFDVVISSLILDWGAISNSLGTSVTTCSHRTLKPVFTQMAPLNYTTVEGMILVVGMKRVIFWKLSRN